MEARRAAQRHNVELWHSAAQRNAVYFASWAGVTTATLFAAFYLPKLIQALPIAEDNIYQPAWQVYDAASTHFDNTAFTYATDYGLAVFMAFGTLYTHRCAPSTLRDRTCSLLTCMCVSVLVGVSRSDANLSGLSITSNEP
eukprot:3801233-Prymnesium_polylepis.1